MIQINNQLSSGLDTWVQGVSSKKIISNSNLNSHRIRLNVSPTDKVSLTFDYFILFADETNRGTGYAQEINLGLRWAISRNLYFLGVAGIAFPDENLNQQAGGDLENWTTVQAPLFFTFKIRTANKISEKNGNKGFKTSSLQLTN